MGEATIDRNQSTRRLAWTLGLVVLYMGAEVVGGLLTNSLALLADAGHMLSDAAALALSLFAIWIARRPPTPQKSYGYYRAEILAALVNGVSLVTIAVYIFYEAFSRLGEPPEVQGALMMGIATGGLFINAIGLWLLHARKDESLNVRGAWLHVMGDALGSIGAISAGALIWAFGWHWADPVASVLIGLLIVWSSWQLLRETVGVLMEQAPSDLDIDQVRDAMRGVPGVENVHDLHVWAVSSGLVSLSAHVEIADPQDIPRVLNQIDTLLADQFDIVHTTIQIELSDAVHTDFAF